MKILLSNDDGIYAPGIITLYESLSKFAFVKVIAPDRDRSAASKSLTLNKPLYPVEINKDFILLDGTPTDCVHYALTCKEFLINFSKPDMVVAGINSGANLGNDVLYSGTVAAATAGLFLGVPSIAISLVKTENAPCKNYQTAAQIAQNIVKKLVDHPLEQHNILNINVPDLPYKQIKGYKITRLGSRHQTHSMIKITDPRGKDGYWIGLSGAAQDAGVDTDFYAIKSGYVSITPLKMDITHHEYIENVRTWAETLEY